MALESNFKNMVIALTATCFVCAAVLAGVYALTKAPIEETNANILKASIGQVLPEGGELSEAKSSGDYIYYESVKDGEVIAYAVKTVTIGFGGNLSLMVGVTPDGVVYNTSVLEHSETPGLGAKCKTDEGFMSQWRGFDTNVKSLQVKKDGGDVDAITASTITSRAYALAVKNAVDLVKELVTASPASEETTDEITNETEE